MSCIEINNLMESLKLGAVINEPVQVTGGLLHKMYRVNTNKGAYDVKVLNAEIMKRPVAFQNTVNSEKIAAGFQSIIPVVSALEIDGRQIHEWNGTHYMIFDWVEDASIFPPMITSENCYAIGDILGKIHQEKLAVDDVAPEEDGATMFDWDKYGEQLPEYKAEDWDAVFAGSFCGMLGWLEYNVKRALEIETGSTDDS